MSKHTTYMAACLGAFAAAALSLPLAASAAGQEGMIAVRDPQTGQLRAPTAAELATLRAQGAAMQQPALKTAPAAVVRRADGTLQKQLGEDAMVYTVVTRDAAGKLQRHCVEGEDAANAATLEAPAASNHKEHNHETE